VFGVGVRFLRRVARSGLFAAYGADGGVLTRCASDAATCRCLLGHGRVCANRHSGDSVYALRRAVSLIDFHMTRTPAAAVSTAAIADPHNCGGRTIGRFDLSSSACDATASCRQHRLT